MIIFERNEKKVIFIGFISFILMIFIIGCAENEEKNNVIPSKTYTWTARQVTEDIPIDLDFSDGFQLLYSTLMGGDTLIIIDNISHINYNQDLNVTFIIYEWSEESESNSFVATLEGNIANIYHSGLMVKITLTIKYVKFTFQKVNFEMEIFDEQWESIEYFKNDINSGGEGFIPLPQSTIKLV
jgi:hypothetical protein